MPGSGSAWLALAAGEGDPVGLLGAVGATAVAAPPAAMGVGDSAGTGDAIGDAAATVAGAEVASTAGRTVASGVSTGTDPVAGVWVAVPPAGAWGGGVQPAA